MASSKIQITLLVALLCRCCEQAHPFGAIFRNAITLQVEPPKIVLRCSKTLVGCLAIVLGGLFVIFRDSLAVFVSDTKEQMRRSKIVLDGAFEPCNSHFRIDWHSVAIQVRNRNVNL